MKNMIFKTIMWVWMWTVVNVHAEQPPTESAVFELAIWAPDEVAPVEAHYAEWGDLYQYLYNPEVVTFALEESVKTLSFQFHQRLGNRYQFRWITASHPSTVTLEKMKDGSIQIQIDPNADHIYFEVWVFDTLTGKQFMADPTIIVKT